MVDKVQQLRLGMRNVAQTRSLSSQIVSYDLGRSDPLRFIAEWNRTGADSPRRLCVHELIKAQVERTPEFTVVFHCEPFTHAELGSGANPLARHLRPLGISRETLYGLCLECPQDIPIALSVSPGHTNRAVSDHESRCCAAHCTIDIDLMRLAHPALPQAALENGKGVYGNLG